MKKEVSENNQKQEGFDFYSANPFSGIWRSLGALAVLLGILFTVILIVYFFWRKNDFAKIATLLFFLYAVIMIGLTVYISGSSYIRLRKVEHAVGKRYKDRSDFALPEYQREWFLEYAIGAGFQVFHHDYFREIIDVCSERVRGDHGSGSQTYYKILFINCNGKKDSFRLNHTKKELYRFAKWYGIERYQWKDIMEKEL